MAQVLDRVVVDARRFSRSEVTLATAFGPNVDWGEAKTWIYLVVVVSVLAVGLLGLAGSFRVQRRVAAEAPGP